MAFEAFRTQQSQRPRRRRRVTYMLSFAVHAVLIAVGVAYSFWHIEELSPPGVHVTFMSATPPPPPPPPPGGGGAVKKKVQVKPKTVVVPKPTEIVQPRETPPPEKRKHEDEDEDEDEDGQKGGVKGGVKGGSIGGTVGGTQGGTPGGVIGGGGPAAQAPKFLAPNMGLNQVLSGANPPFPPAVRRAGVTLHVLVKICVTRTGQVDKVTLLKSDDSRLDEGVLTTAKSWRYRPLLANNTPVPFCYPHDFLFKGE